MPAQRNQRSTSSHHQGRKHHRQAWQRRQRQAQQPGRYRPVELSIGTAIDQVVEGQNGDTFGIAVRSLCVRFHPSWE